MRESKATDAELVVDAIGGDHEAFAVIVARYQTLVCSLTYSATGCPRKSEEVAHDVFVTAWKDLRKLRRPERLKSWLCGIARNQVRNFIRGQVQARKCFEPVSDDGRELCPEPTPGERVCDAEDEAIVWRALQALPERYREPMVLFYREQESIENVARALDLSNEAVRQRLSRGRRKLQDSVLSVIGGTLRRSAPTTAFTIGVLSVLRELSPAAAASYGASGVAGAANTAGESARAGWVYGLGGAAVVAGALLLSYVGGNFVFGGGLAAAEKEAVSFSEEVIGDGGAGSVDLAVAAEAGSGRGLAGAGGARPGEVVGGEHPLVALRRLYREAEGLVHEGHREEAGEVYEQLLRVAREADEPWYAGRALWRLGGTARQKGELAAGVEQQEQGLVYMREHRKRTGANADAELRILSSLMWQHHAQGELTLARMANWRAEETAIEYLTESLAGFDGGDFLYPKNGYLGRLPGSGRVVRVLLNEGFFLGFWGDLDEAIRLTGDVAAVLEERTDLSYVELGMLADAYYYLITYFEMQARWEEKREVQRLLYAMNPTNSVSRSQTLDRLRDTFYEGQRGEGNPEELFREVKMLLERRPFETREMDLRLNRYLAPRLAGIGRLDEGIRLLSDSIAEAETVDLHETLALLRHHRAMLRLDYGILEGVEEDLLAALDFYRRNGFVFNEASIYRDYLRWLSMSGRYEEARGILSLGLERAGRFGSVKLRDELLEIGEGLEAWERREPTAGSGRVDLQPIRMVSRVHEEEFGRGRFTLVNTGFGRSEGELVIAAPVTAEHWNAERRVWAVAIGSEGDGARRGFSVDPGERIQIYLESSAEAVVSGSEFSVRWESEENQEAWWRFDGGAELETASVVQVSLAMENPFYPVPLYHEIYLRDGNAGPVDFRVRSSFPAYVQVVDADSGRLLAIDASGDGRFDGVGDAILRDAGRNGYPDFAVDPDGKIPAIEIHVYPVRKDGEPPEEIVVALDLRAAGGEWMVQAENRLLTEELNR